MCVCVCVCVLVNLNEEERKCSTGVSILQEISIGTIEKYWIDWLLLNIEYLYFWQNFDITFQNRYQYVIADSTMLFLHILYFPYFAATNHTILHFVTLFEGILFYKLFQDLCLFFYSVLILYTFIILSLSVCHHNSFHHLTLNYLYFFFFFLIQPGTFIINYIIQTFNQFTWHSPFYRTPHVMTP